MTIPKEGKKVSPPAAKVPPKAPSNGKSGPAAPPPPPHHGAAHHYYPYVPPGAPNLPPGYDGHHEPPRGPAGAPGPYTTAQYEKARAGMTLPPPPYHGGPPPPPPVARSSTNSSSGSPPTAAGGATTAAHANRGRDPPPPHAHYPSMPPPPTHQDRPGNGPYPPPPHWPPRYTQPPFAGPPQPYPDPHHPPPGPYRFSDLSLRREAVSKLSSAAAAYHAASASGHLNHPNKHGEVMDGREGATSPSQIESSHREEVTTMGCTCKKTKCLKLYCQCFGVKIYCGTNCRCLICHNTVKYEKERKDAIRTILMRNPAAFDTKFKKDKQTIVPDRVLAHKLGCKCRKSNCMKKYCECYAGNVKCSANCRCVGCKNMPRGGFGPSAPGSNAGPNMVASSSNVRVIGQASVATNNEDGSPPGGKRSEPWMMNAAHNLAFLKHASPAAQKQKRMQSIETGEGGSIQTAGEGGSIPSLGSEESSPPVEKPKGGIQKPTSSERTAVNALLMAAMAMTEMSGQNNGEEEEAKAAAPTPGKDDSRTTQMEEDDCETPQKNLLAKFNSPKRKQSDPDDTIRLKNGNNNDQSDEDEEDESPKRDHPGGNTPCSNEQKVKRSRLGSHKKFPRSLGKDMEHQRLATSVLNGLNNNGAAMTTPKQKGQLNNKDLTPVSARCIDFRKMHVNETNSAQAETQN